LLCIGTSDDNLELVVGAGDASAGKVLTRLASSGLNHRLDVSRHAVVWIGELGRGKGIVLSRVPGKSEGDTEQD
jgi:hypothetical protein